MKWTPYDKNQVTNLVIALKKAKFEMTGMEIVAFADVFKWVSSLHDHIEQEALLKPAPAPLNPTAVHPQLDSNLTQPAVAPEKQEEKPVKKAKASKKE